MIDASTIFLPSIPSLQLTNWIFSVRAVTRRKENRENLWKNQSFVQKFHYTTIFLLQKENGVSLRDFRRGCSINFAARSRVLRVIAPSSYHDRSLRGGGGGFCPGSRAFPSAYFPPLCADNAWEQRRRIRLDVSNFGNERRPDIYWVGLLGMIMGRDAIKRGEIAGFLFLLI